MNGFNQFVSTWRMKFRIKRLSAVFEVFLAAMIFTVLSFALSYTAGNCKSLEDFSDEYAPYKKIGIEESIEKKSCEGLQRAFDATDDAKLLGFIDWHLNNIGCYK